MTSFEEIKSTTPYNSDDNILKITIDSEHNGYRLTNLIHEIGSYFFVVWVKSDSVCNVEFNILGTTDSIEVRQSWVKYTKQINADSLDNRDIIITPDINSTTYYYEAYLAKGTTDTSWTPAPEDIEDELNTNYITKTETESIIKIEFDKVVTSVSKIESRLDKDYYTKTETESKIQVESDRINSTVSKVEEIEKNTITSSTEQFYLSSSHTELIGGSWNNEQPQWVDGKYLWRRTLVKKGDGSMSFQPSDNGVCITGNTGQNGTSGNGVSDITNYYLATSMGNGVTDSTHGWTTSVQSMSNENKYLWNYEKVSYTNGKEMKTTPCIIGVFGSDGINGVDGNGIKSITEYYQVSSSNTTPPISWVTNVPILTPVSKYLWNYEKIEFTNGTSEETKKRVIGVYGDKGENGLDGKDAAIQSPTPPEDKTQLWLDISADPPLLKRWDGNQWNVVNDVTGTIESLREELTSTIEQESGQIKMEVSQNYFTKGEANQLQTSINTQFEQTKNDFTFKFNEYNRELNELEGNMNSEFQTISEYIRFFNGNIEMGAVGNEFKQLLTRTKNSFMQSGVEIAYFGNRKMYVTDGEFTNSCQIGNFGFIPEANSSLSFRKVR